MSPPSMELESQDSRTPGPSAHTLLREAPESPETPRTVTCGLITATSSLPGFRQEKPTSPQESQRALAGGELPSLTVGVHQLALGAHPESRALKRARGSCKNGVF